MIVWLLAGQLAVAVPASPAPALPPVTSGYSIVVARAVSQGDPQRIECGAPNCTSWFLGRFDQAETLAGQPLPPQFDARIEMGSPFISKYRLLLLLARGPDGKLRVRGESGFHTRTNVGCLDFEDVSALHPALTGDRLFRQGRQLCAEDR